MIDAAEIRGPERSGLKHGAHPKAGTEIRIAIQTGETGSRTDEGLCICSGQKSVGLLASMASCRAKSPREDCFRATNPLVSLISDVRETLVTGGTPPCKAWFGDPELDLAG